MSQLAFSNRDQQWEQRVSGLQGIVLQLRQEARALLVKQIRASLINRDAVLTELGYECIDDRWNEAAYAKARLTDGLVGLLFCEGVKKDGEALRVADGLDQFLLDSDGADQQDVAFRHFLPDSINHQREPLELLTGASAVPLMQSAKRLLGIEAIKQQVDKLSSVDLCQRTKSVRLLGDIIHSKHNDIIAGTTQFSRLLARVTCAAQALFRLIVPKKSVQSSVMFSGSLFGFIKNATNLERQAEAVVKMAPAA